MSYFLLYLILMLDNISEMFAISTMILFIGLCISLIVIAVLHAIIASDCCRRDDADERHKDINSMFKKIFKIGGISLITCLILGTFLPTTKQAATIYLLPKIASNKDMQQLPSKTAELLLLEVKKEIASLDVNNISGITNGVTKKK